MTRWWRRPDQDPAAPPAGMIRGPGKTLADVEAWCVKAREAGADGSTYVFVVVDRSARLGADATPRELRAWPRATTGPADPPPPGPARRKDDPPEAPADLDQARRMRIWGPCGACGAACDTRPDPAGGNDEIWCPECGWPDTAPEPGTTYTFQVADPAGGEAVTVTDTATPGQWTVQPGGERLAAARLKARLIAAPGAPPAEVFGAILDAAQAHLAAGGAMWHLRCSLDIAQQHSLPGLGVTVDAAWLSGRWELSDGDGAVIADSGGPP